jgi:transposase InsO family protein
MSTAKQNELRPCCRTLGYFRGGQYAGGDYRKLIKKAKLTQSMSRKGQCLDNAPMESFFASLKKGDGSPAAL